MKREKNLWKIMAWLIEDEIRNADWRDVLAAIISLALSVAFFMLFFKR